MESGSNQRLPRLKLWSDIFVKMQNDLIASRVFRQNKAYGELMQIESLLNSLPKNDAIDKILKRLANVKKH